jgi:cell wall-associated NlpC family hydrolase
MRKLILSSVIALALVGCSTTAIADQAEPPKKQPAIAIKTVVKNKVLKVTSIFNDTKTLTFLEKEALRFERIQEHKKQLVANTKRVNAVLKNLKTYAGKTWYVFSGSTPRGWDCSGLVRWTYLQLGIELEHRASLQADSGKRVSKPVPGDIVAYFYPGGTRSYHTAIYLGNGKMINAPKPGTRTAIEPVHTYRLKGSQVRYIRMIEQARGN